MTPFKLAIGVCINALVFANVGGVFALTITTANLLAVANVPASILLIVSGKLTKLRDAQFLNVPFTQFAAEYNEVIFPKLITFSTPEPEKT